MTETNIYLAYCCLFLIIVHLMFNTIVMAIRESVRIHTQRQQPSRPEYTSKRVKSVFPQETNHK